MGKIVDGGVFLRVCVVGEKIGGGEGLKKKKRGEKGLVGGERFFCVLGFFALF